MMVADEEANIEYNPTPLSSTYATARILYHDRESAVRAREHEVRAATIPQSGVGH